MLAAWLSSVVRLRPRKPSRNVSGLFSTTLMTGSSAKPHLASEFGEHVGEDRWDDVVRGRTGRPMQRPSGPAGRRQIAVLVRRARCVGQVAVPGVRQRVAVVARPLSLAGSFYPLNQIVGLHVEVPDVLINQQRLDSVADAQIYIKRITATRTLFGQLTARMSAQAAKGIYMPKRSIRC